MSETLSISIIVPVYNAEKFLKRCIYSLLNQNFRKHYEIILIDDASTDSSVNIIKEINSSLIKLIPQKSNNGPASARNVGLNNAKGKYIFFVMLMTQFQRTLLKLYTTKQRKIVMI